jgi:subfamily B ATP-binding cassette protein HlyB/CyaB
MLFITHGLPRGLEVDAIFRLGPQGAQLLQQVGSAQAVAAAKGGA